MSQLIPEPGPGEEDSPDPQDALQRKDRDRDRDAEDTLWDGADSDARPITEDGTRPRVIPD